MNAPASTPSPNRLALMLVGIAAMMLVVAISNYLVQFAINDWLTWAAFTYPVAFLVTDTMNRFLGVRDARIVVLFGFILAVILSIWLATPRIAVASGSAFLVAQLLDVTLFDRLRHRAWWQAPLLSSTLASVIDTALFFTIAFVGTPVPWVTLALGDLLAKALMLILLLIPFRFFVSMSRAQPHAAS